MTEGLTTASGKHNNPSLNDLSFQLSDQLLGGGGGVLIQLNSAS